MTSPPRKPWQNDGRTTLRGIMAWQADCRRCYWTHRSFSKAEAKRLAMEHDLVACNMNLSLRNLREGGK